MRALRYLALLSVSVACFGFGPRSAAAQSAPAGAYQDLAWRMIGPFRGGRTRAVAGVPSMPAVFYVGAVNGGVWKTDDAGRTWQPIFDAESTQSIGAIAVAPADPNIIYVGSGEGLHAAGPFGGQRHLPLRTTADTPGRTSASPTASRSPRSRSIRRIPAGCSPQFSVTPMARTPSAASTARSIRRVTWQQVLYKDQDTGGSALEIDPANPQVVYAALWKARLGPWEDKNEFNGTGGGLFKSDRRR